MKTNNIMGKQAVILKNPNISWKINSTFFKFFQYLPSF